jgi:protein RecA
MNMAFDFEALGKSLAKATGANADPSQVPCWLDTGFAPLNFAISNDYNKGLPGGRIIEIYGPPSCGKTALSNNVMISAQEMGGIAMFHDHERAFYTDLAKKLGLDKYVESVRHIRSAGLEIEKPIVCVFDSLASMIPQAQLAKDMSKQGMHDKLALAAATSPTFRVLASIAEEFNVCTVFLNQIRQKPGVMFGDSTTTPGGNAPEFYASVRISLFAKKLYANSVKDKDAAASTDFTPIGQEVVARLTKNKVNRPFLKAKWNFLFKPDGSGYFDAIGSTLDFMVDKKVIDRSGAWIMWSDGKKYQRSGLIKKIVEEGGDSVLRKMLTDSGVECELEEPVEEVME